MIWLKAIHLLAFVALISAADEPVKAADPAAAGAVPVAAAGAADPAAVPVAAADPTAAPVAAADPAAAAPVVATDPAAPVAAAVPDPAAAVPANPDAVPAAAAPAAVGDAAAAVPVAAAAPAAAAAAPSDVVDEKNVLILTKVNFTDTVKNSKLILVEFYAPWCGHCKALTPEYAKAATELAASNPDIKLAKLDATQDEELARGFGVQGFPTLKLFRESNDVPIDYTGGRTADDITAWLKKKTQPPAKSLATPEATTEFIASAPVVVVGYFEDDKTPEAKAYLTAADSIDEFPLAIVSGADVAAKQEAKNGNVVLYKKFDEGKAVYDGDAKDATKIRGFLVNQSFPLISQLNTASTQKIFGGPIQEFVLLFVSVKAEHLKNHTDAIKAIGAEYRGQILIVEVDIDQKENLDMSEYFNLRPEDIPAVRIVKSEPDMERYVPTTKDFNGESIKSFIVSYLKGDIKKEDMPQEGDPTVESENVKTLTADNYEAIVMDLTKDVFVEFYAPWCGHCKELVPIWEQLGQLYKTSASVVIAKMDATEHKVPNMEIEGFPTLKLFRKGDKQVFDFEGERNLVSLYEYVEGFNEQRDPDEGDDEGADDEDQDAGDDVGEGEGDQDADPIHDDGAHDDFDGAHDDGVQDDGAHDDGAHDDGAHDDGAHDDGAHDDGGHDEGAPHDEGEHDEGAPQHYDPLDDGGDDAPVHDEAYDDADAPPASDYAGDDDENVHDEL